MSLELILLATAAGLLAVAAWWFGPILRAIAQERMPARDVDPVPLHCELGATLMASAAVDAGTDPGPAGGPATTGAAGSGGAGASGGTGGALSTKARPARKKVAGPSRRQFLRTSFLAGWGGVLGAFSLASLGFLWPRVGQGFGAANLVVGSEDEVAAGIESGGGRYEFPSGKLYMVPYSVDRDPDGKYADVTDGGTSPFMAVYQKCVHLGCRVPWCESSRWFECPCHGSRYNGWGEYQFGPAPRGLDRFAARIENGQVIVNTQNVITGPSRGAGVLDQPPEGAHCN